MWKFTTVDRSFFNRKAIKSTSTWNPIVSTPNHKWNPPEDGPRSTPLCDFINDMPAEIIHSYLYLFADDTKLFKTIHNITDCELLQEDIEREQYWTDQAQLELHPDKCKHMRIRPTNIPHTTFKYYLRKDRAPLQSTLQENYIGVIIDQDLSFDKHITAKINKANSILGIINKTFDYRVMLTLFKSFVRLHIEFVNQVWAPYLIKHITAIYKNVQRIPQRLTLRTTAPPY